MPDQPSRGTAGGPRQSIGVIAAGPGIDRMAAHLSETGVRAVAPSEVTTEHRVVLIPAAVAKGLEFDHVLLMEPANIVRASPHGHRLRHVALTRAITQLVILHTDELPGYLTANQSTAEAISSPLS